MKKSTIQALDPLDRPSTVIAWTGGEARLRTSPAWDVVSFAALNTQTEEIIGQTAARHTSQEFVSFLEEVISTQPAEREIHVILDNFATHKTDLVKQFLAEHPNVALHFTPTYSSWLNQVQNWFTKLQRDSLIAACSRWWPI